MSGQQQHLTPDHSAKNSHDLGKRTMFHQSTTLIPTPSATTASFQDEQNNSSSNNNLTLTTSRESASRANPVLAPFTRTQSGGSISDNNDASNSKVSLESRDPFPTTYNGFRTVNSSQSNSLNKVATSGSKEVPALQVNDEFGEVISPTASKQTAATSGSSISDSSLQAMSRTWSTAESNGGANENRRSSSRVSSSVPVPHFSVVNAIKDLKSSLESDIVGRLDSTEIDLDSQVKNFETSLSRLKELRDKCNLLIEDYKSVNQKALSNMGEQANRLVEIQKEFDVVDKLEERLQKARSNVDDCKNRLFYVNQRVSVQENDNKERNRRIKYIQRGSLLGFTLLVLLIFLIRHYYYYYVLRSSPSYKSLEEIIQCLDDLDSCQKNQVAGLT